MALKSYKELIVWQKSFKLTLIIFQATKKFPKSEIYGLVSQMRRAAFAIPSNIAEGYARKHRKEYAQFIRIVYGSGAELETQVLIAKEINFLDKKEFKEIDSLLTEVMKMLNGLIKRLENRP